MEYGFCEEGLEALPQGFVDLLSGAGRGMMLVRI